MTLGRRGRALCGFYRVLRFRGWRFLPPGLETPGCRAWPRGSRGGNVGRGQRPTPVMLLGRCTSPSPRNTPTCWEWARNELTCDQMTLLQDFSAPRGESQAWGNVQGKGRGWGPSPQVWASGFGASGGLGTESVGAAGAPCGSSQPLRTQVHVRLDVGGLVFIL